MFGIARITWNMVKEKKRGKGRKTNKGQKTKNRITVFIYHILSFIFRKTLHKNGSSW